MAFKSLVFNVVIASPSDLNEERNATRDAIHEWNDLHAEAERVTLLPRMWETGATPETGVRPQASVNKQLVDNADLLIGMFWTKLGKSTGVADSGTVEEIDRTVAAGKTAMLYFSERLVAPGKIDVKQIKKLQQFKDDTFKKALVGSFNSVDGLKVALSRDLTRRVREMMKVIGDKVGGGDESDWRSKVKLETSLSLTRYPANGNMGHVRELVVDVVNAGLELNSVSAVLMYPDQNGAEIRQHMYPRLETPNPFKLGNSARFSVSWDDPSVALPMASRPLTETQIEIYHGPQLAKAIPAKEWEWLLKAFAEPDPSLPRKPIQSGGRIPTRTWIDLPLDYRNYSR